MGVNVGTAIAFLELDMSPFKNSLASAGAELRNFATGGDVQSLSNAMTGIGSELTKKVTLPIVGIGAAATSASMDFEAQMSKVKAISGATGEDFKGLRDQAIKLGADTNFSASEAANGMENLASAGFKTEEIMKAMPGMLDLAASGGVDIATASDIAGSSLRGFGMEAQEVTHVADVLAKVAGDTNAGITDTGEAMKYIAPVAHALGVTFEDTSAAIGLLSNAGIKGSQAGTTLRGALTSLAAPSKEAKKLIEEMGFAFFDANGAMKPMSEVTGQLRDKTAGLTQQQKASVMETLFGKEAMSGMLAIVDQGPEKLSDLSGSLKNCNGASKEMAGTMQDNLKGSLEAMKGSLETAAIKIGDVLAPTIREAAEWIGELVNKFSNLPAGTQEFIVKIGVVAAAVGPALLVFGKLVSSIKNVISVVSGISKAFNVITTLPALLNPPVLIVIAIIAGIGLIVYEIIKHWDDLKEFFGGFWKGIKDLFNGIWEWLKNFFSDWGPVILDILMPFIGIPLEIIKHWDDIKAALGAVFDFLKDGFDGVVKFFDNGLKGIGMMFNGFLDFAKNIGKNICEGLVNGLVEGWEWVKDKVGGVVSGIKNIFTGGLDIHSPSRVFKGYGININEGLVEGLDSHQGAVNQKVSGIAESIKGLGNVKPDFSGLSKAGLTGGAYSGTPKSLSNMGTKQLNFNPNIIMHVTVADTGQKGTEQLTSEVKGMAENAFKNSMVEEFLADAVRL